MLIIGVVGQIAAGKGVLVNYLVNKYNFVSFSLSTIVHEELKRENIQDFTRETMQEVGNRLRNEYGDDILAKRAIEKLQRSIRPLADKDQNYIIEGIRNPGEIKFLKKNSNFILIGIKTEKKLRFDRLLSRKKPWDPKNWNDFIKVDNQDLGTNQKESGQQVGKCLAYCDYVLTNNKDIKDFQNKVNKLWLNLI